MNGDDLVAGCKEDHAIKIVDVEKSYVVKQSVHTNFKAPCCLDTAQDSLILAGCEDGAVRLWDVRAGDRSKLLRSEYKGHSKWVTSVNFNS